MKRNFWIATFLLILLVQETIAQKKWTLGDCVTYAVTNNLQLQRQRLQTENDKVILAKSEMDLLPNLNFESDGRIGFGRSIDPVTNLITFKQNISNSYTLSSSMAIFNGFAYLNTISANRFMLKAGIEKEKIATNTLVIDILGAFYQVIYAKGLEDAAKMQVDLSEKQLFRIQKNVEVGRESLSKQYEMESRASDDRLSYTIAKNTASQALTSLKQLLQLAPGTDFDIVMPDLNTIIIPDVTFNTDSVYNIASVSLPRLKALNYEMMASKRQLAAAKGGIFPKLTVGGAVFTGFYKVIAEGAGEQDSYRDQMKANNSQAVYMSFQIPIFNNYVNGKNIRQAKIRKNDDEIRFELEKNALYTDVENACLNYNRGKDEYTAALSNYEYNKKSFEAVEKKFETGLLDVTDYAAAQAALFKSETESIRTKLQLVIRKYTIEFYSTGEYEQIINN